MKQTRSEGEGVDTILKRFTLSRMRTSFKHSGLIQVMVLCLFYGPTPLRGVVSTAAEFAKRDAWTHRVFAVAKTPEPACLKIAFEDVGDGLARGRSWRGTPYQLGEKTYRHGLSFNASKHVLVRLGQPAERFIADIGLENNDDTIRGEALGNGSVVFQVFLGGKEVFKSPVMRRKNGPLRLAIPLQGEREFELRVGDAGDGRGWDQALWAEAEVLLRDGTTLRLQDLPLEGTGDGNPFGLSFRYAGTNSSELMPRWKCTLEQKSNISTLRYRDPITSLGVSVEFSVFTDFPAVEWTVFLKNTGSSDTPILEDLQALDGVLPTTPGFEPTLHWAKGGVASFDDFAPQLTAMKRGTNLRLQPGGGRSSSQVLPFFNLEGAGEGVIAAIGWTGEWLTKFDSEAGGVRLRAGMEKTHLILKPGETIRTPRMLLLFYEGDQWRGQNLLRQFILRHHRPQKNGLPLVAPITCGNWGATPAAVHLDNIRQIVKERLPIEYYWIDAEWFGQGSWYPNAGNWTVKKDVYPAGFKPLSDNLRAANRELMLWFEPERVYRGTPWHKEHPEWLIGPLGDNLLFNLGNPDATKFLTDFISSRIDEFGLGCYRQDFNFDPLPYWKAADEPNRQGITEIRYIEGLYEFWDALLAKHPGLIIDNCASGGRRLDIEMLGRATPFWRTDGPRDPLAHQCHTYGLLPWVPLSATSQDRAGDDYEFRSSMCSALCLNWWVSGDAPAGNIPAEFPFEWCRKTLSQYLEIRDFYYGDYYPLTPYSPSKELWMVYQLDRPQSHDGMLVALRRPDSPYETARFALKELDPEATYRLTNLDCPGEIRRTGKELIRDGVPIEIKSRPGSILLRYQRE